MVEFSDGIPGSVAAKVHPFEAGKPWAVWRARWLNELFASKGTGGEPRILPETVQDGLGKFMEG